MFNGVELIVIRSCLVKEKTELNNTLEELTKKPRTNDESPQFLDTIEQLTVVEEVLQKVDKLMCKK